MEDIKILELFFNRDERAVEEVDRTYKYYLLKVLGRLLTSQEDKAECLNDTYLSAWNSIPPQKPSHLNLYLARIAKNKALDLLKREQSGKRIDKKLMTVIDELEDVVDEHNQPEKEIMQAELTGFINDFLYNLPELERTIFIRRYWFMESMEDIASRVCISKSNVKVRLYRIRQQLKNELLKGGYEV